LRGRNDGILAKTALCVCPHLPVALLLFNVLATTAASEGTPAGLELSTQGGQLSVCRLIDREVAGACDFNAQAAPLRHVS
jgi:hypothetical protein